MIAMGVIWYLCEVDEEAEYDDDEDALDRHRFGRDDD
jgi:hypothetical protein